MIMISNVSITFKDFFLLSSNLTRKRTQHYSQYYFMDQRKFSANPICRPTEEEDHK
jgi:hypothetical protein